ncbi:MAG TPA: hypothetical protein VKV77_07490 [Methylovirgula sp.]|nr:hypothetical protein [Methylovirgula sp.]
MRRGAEFYRYPLLPEEPASIYDTSLDPEGRPVTVDWLIFKFERPGDGDQNAVIKITCEGLLVETV